MKNIDLIKKFYREILLIALVACCGFLFYKLEKQQEWIDDVKANFVNYVYQATVVISQELEKQNVIEE